MTVIDLTNGLPVFGFYDSVESKLIKTQCDFEHITKNAQYGRDKFKVICKDRYKQFYDLGEILNVVSRNDIELVNIITGIFTLAYNFKGKYEDDGNEQHKRHYGITKCCATIINVHQQGGTTRADTYDMTNFFKDTEIIGFHKKKPIHNIHKAIKNFVEWQLKENLMINVSGLPYVRWPEWLPEKQKSCNCASSSRTGPNKHIYTRLFDLHGRYKG